MKKEISGKRVVIGGVRQNCYALDCRDTSITGTDVKFEKPNRTIDKFISLEKKELPNGYVQELVEKDYPINSESVSSYMESSDYRNDPAQAIANAPKRVNLGDITQAQDFLKNNPVESTMQYADILQKVSNYFKAQAVQQKQAQGAQGKTTEGGNE